MNMLVDAGVLLSLILAPEIVLRIDWVVLLLDHASFGVARAASIAFASFALA